MRRFRLYADSLSLRGGLRAEEITRIVLANWMGHEDRFEPEFPVRADNPAAYEAYWNLTAERVLLRRMVLGNPVSQDILDADELPGAHPFGPLGPTFAELTQGGVSVAMMCLPLAHPGDSRKAVMARLYCVKGLHRPQSWWRPFAEPPPAVYEGCSWFLLGTGSHLPVEGSSWQLAARLLMRVLLTGDMQLRKLLAKEFVATGSVDGNERLHKVELLGKKVLAERSEFRTLRWLVPTRNVVDAMGLNHLAAGTVEEAWKNFRRQLSGATKALIETVRGGVREKDLERIGELLRAGADTNASDPETDRNARQFLMLNVQDKTIGLIKHFWEHGRTQPEKVLTDGELIRAFQRVLEPEWYAAKMCSYYGNKPLMFFQLARRAVETGDLSQIRAIVGMNDINATDRDGETVLDFASEMNDVAVVDILEGLKLGARKRAFRLTSKKMRMVLRDMLGVSPYLTGTFLDEAFQDGLDPLAKTRFTTMYRNTPAPCTRWVWDNFRSHELAQGDYDPWSGADQSFIKVSYEETTLLQEAILATEEDGHRLRRAQSVVQKCLDQLLGMQRDHRRIRYAPIQVRFGDGRVVASYRDLARRFSSPAISGLVHKVFDELGLE